MNKKTLATAGLICACAAILFTILGMILYFFAFIAPLCSIAGIVLGAMGMKKEDGSTNGMGVAALIIGIVFLVIDIPVFICGVCACQVACALAEAGNSINDLANALGDLEAWY